jgi:hypothetical protein
VTKSVFCEGRDFPVSSGLEFKNRYDKNLVEIGVRRVVITALLATFFGIDSFDVP